MRKIEQDKIKTLLSYYNKQQSLTNERTNERTNSSIAWKPFKIGEICLIKSGVRLIKSDMQLGNIPFIGASDSNNGITEFISNINSSLDKNILGVNYNGSVVENFYHPYQCIFSDDVKRLEIKGELNRNKWVYLFLKTAILKQKEKYQYGYKFNAQRMIKQKILLPTTPQGEIHFEFMEKMMMQKELAQVMKLLAYFEKNNKC